MSDRVKMTVSTFAATMGIDNKAYAAATLKCLVDIGQAELLSEVVPPIKEVEPGVLTRAMGKPQLVYAVNRNITINIPDYIKDVEIPKLVRRVAKVKVVEFAYEPVDADAELAAIEA